MHRRQRIEDQLRAELAWLLQREVRDPRVRLATVTRVEVTRDLSYATVGISALGSDEERELTIEALVHARGFLRRELAHRLSLRSTPELRFRLDRGAEHSQEISDLLDNLGLEKEDSDAP